MTITRTLDPTLIPVDDDGFQEFIGHILLVVLLDGRDDILTLLALALDETIDSDLDALPTLVTVHRVVAANNGGDLAILLLLQELLELLCVAGGRARSGIATVAEKVDINVGNLLLLRCLEEGEEVADVGVDTAVGDLPQVSACQCARGTRRAHQTQEVQTSVTLLGALAALQDDLVLVELTLFDRDIDLHDVLPDDATRSNVQVAAIT